MSELKTLEQIMNMGGGSFRMEHGKIIIDDADKFLEEHTTLIDGRDLRKEVIKTIKAIKNCRGNPNDFSCIYYWGEDAAKNLLKLFPDLREPSINDIHTMVFILKWICNITEEEIENG